MEEETAVVDEEAEAGRRRRRKNKSAEGVALRRSFVWHRRSLGSAAIAPTFAQSLPSATASNASDSPRAVRFPSRSNRPTGRSIPRATRLLLLVAARIRPLHGTVSKAMRVSVSQVIRRKKIRDLL